jgi:hypothetical protein
MRAAIQVYKGLRGRLEQSADGNTWIGGDFTPGPALIDIDLTDSIYNYFRIALEADPDSAEKENK